MSHRYEYHRMKAKEFRSSLDALRLTVPDLVKIVGCTHKRALAWFSGREDFPHTLPSFSL